MRRAVRLPAIAPCVLIARATFIAHAAAIAVAALAALGVLFPGASHALAANPSYLVRLPAGYTPDRRWPILYCFDPGRRGAIPIELFREAADRNGFIISSSTLFSAGDSTRRVLRILGDLWDDTNARYAIDRRRVYAAGFSAGGRICWIFCRALQGVDMAGVIEAGAGLPSPDYLDAWRPRGFFHYGLCGDTDFNHYEMRRMDRLLEKIGIPHRTVFFEGGHEWPPAEACGRALDWMAIASMRAGTVPRDRALIESVYTSEIRRAAADEDSGRALDAYERWRTIAEEFRGLRDVSRPDERVRALAATEKLQRAAALADSLEALGAERLSQADLALTAFEENRRIGGEAMPDSELVSRIGLPAILRDVGSANRDVRLAAQRVLEGIYVRLVRYVPSRLRAGGDWTGAEEAYRIATCIKPQDPTVWYDLACAASRAGDREAALAALRRSLDLGLADTTLLRTDPDLENVRKDPRFREIVGTRASRSR